jgi:hypothetical protein
MWQAGLVGFSKWSAQSYDGFLHAQAVVKFFLISSLAGCMVNFWFHRIILLPFFLVPSP